VLRYPHRCGRRRAFAVLKKAPAKIALSLRLSPQVVEAFRASGEGWQTRIDVVQADWLKTYSPDELTV